ncbi:MAG: hypothetical protein GY819_13315 [Planctomycetaceae bacterium]|nr:hypothetical protein [Planctomycetaceae bacterium]MCP4463768.1 hypothetical protein [Planctomycetaceae bacterium]MDG1808137.1 hypothetical protein [Pirellulaceae bacterium]MDG2103866.1 hypothetical protein [Pirellulaceae bacterium]
MQRIKKQKFPIVKVAGLISFSIFTLLGVVAGLPPEVVLIRVSIGTAMVIVFGVIFTNLINLMST